MIKILFSIVCFLESLFDRIVYLTLGKLRHYLFIKMVKSKKSLGGFFT